MSGGDILADTNAVIAWMKQDGRLARALLPYQRPLMPLQTLGELLYGAENSAHRLANLAAVEAARETFSIALPTERTAEAYATIRAELRRKGRPIPENDLWIAALAIELGLPLASRDAHFMAVDRLRIVAW